MNGSKVICRQEATLKDCLDSSIRIIGEKLTSSPLIAMVSRHASTDTSQKAFGLWQQRVPFRYVIPIAAVAGAVITTYSLGSYIRYTPNLFFCAVVLSSWLGGVGAGISSIVLSVVALDYFFIPPIYALGLSLEDAPDMVVFVTAGLFVNWVNREGIQAKKATKEGHDERNSLCSEKNHERGETDHSLTVDRSAGELGEVELDRDATSGKDIKKLNGVVNLTTSEIEAEDRLLRKFCAGVPGPAKMRVVTLNGCRRPLRSPLTRRSGRDATFCRHGDYWTIEYEGAVAWLKATRGLESIAYLLANPDREFHVSELIGQAVPVNCAAQRPTQKGGDQMRTVRLESGDPILDARAKAEYKHRLAELREELTEADRFNDLDRVEKIQREVNAITEQLTAAVGLGGRNRRAASQAERARSAVTKRIRGSIQRIAKATPSLGRHLAASVKTGYFCCYNPHPDCSVRWELRV
jgi:hypothetical protein